MSKQAQKINTSKLNTLKSLAVAMISTVVLLAAPGAFASSDISVHEDITQSIALNEILSQSLSEKIQVESGLDWNERNQLENKLIEMAKRSADSSEDSIVLVSLSKLENH